MDYKKFEHLIEVESHKIIMPFYIPEELLQNETIILNELKKYDIEMSEPEIENDLDARPIIVNPNNLTIKRNNRIEDICLKLITEIKTENDPIVRTEFKEAYKRDAGDEWEERLCTPYVEPLSKTSPTEGIYFSSQDICSIVIHITDSEGGYISQVGFIDRAHLYYGPRINFGWNKNLLNDSKNSFGMNLSKFLEEASSSFPKNSPGAIKNTGEGVSIMKKFIEGYAKARDESFAINV